MFHVFLPDSSSNRIRSLAPPPSHALGLADAHARLFCSSILFCSLLSCPSSLARISTFPPCVLPSLNPSLLDLFITPSPSSVSCLPSVHPSLVPCTYILHFTLYTLHTTRFAHHTRLGPLSLYLFSFAVSVLVLLAFFFFGIYWGFLVFCLRFLVSRLGRVFLRERVSG
ncbi:hypothetical protein B0H11DRAFT_1364947 [Mycena galericulata]|nr:hypothetical protein B0H11DRAFT_1364947 [Mycena galericulata]